MVKIMLIADVSAQGKMVFPNISSRATKFTVLNLEVRGPDLPEQTIQFRNVQFE